MFWDKVSGCYDLNNKNIQSTRGLVYSVYFVFDTSF